MPEGHKIHRIARDHQKWFANQQLRVASPQGRFRREARRVNGKKLCKVSAHGKHLFYHWNEDLICHVHLGLYGKFRLFKNPPPKPQGAVRMRVIGDERSFHLHGPNCCELLSNAEYNKILSRLGEDPLGENASPEPVWHKMQRSRTSIGALLLNQSVIAGIGNIYRTEVLYLLGIHPKTPANAIVRSVFDELWSLTVQLMRIGVDHNQIITSGLTLDGRVSRRSKPVETFNIYKRSHCAICEHPVKCFQIANRSVYACDQCQRL